MQAGTMHFFDIVICGVLMHWTEEGMKSAAAAAAAAVFCTAVAVLCVAACCTAASAAAAAGIPHYTSYIIFHQAGCL
jgi:hypothetical protein